MFMVSIYALDVDEHIPRYCIIPEATDTALLHARAMIRFVRGHQLRVSHDSVSLRTQTLGETKRLAQTTLWLSQHRRR
jgi:hypothetical protein